MKNAHKERKDAQIAEFLSKDLGDDLRRSGSGVMIRPKMKQRLTSIFLDPMLVSKLKEKAEKRGLKYQTMLKTIVYEHVDEY